jgi:signal transduction histidine kinase
LDNAIKFTPEDGKVIAELGITDKEAFICVKDTGIGIPENDLNVLFNRFHRGRNATNYAGNGLGLAIVKTIVDKHNGRITVQSDTSGTCFGVYLPLEVQHDSTN